MPPIAPGLAAYWPATQAMDLVEARLEAAAEAVLSEYESFARASDTGGHASLSWHEVAAPQDAFALLDPFDNIPSRVVLLPTHSRWTVTLTNSFLCDGFDSLCNALTRLHGLTTIHWSAHDSWTTFQSGALFHHRSSAGERRVQAAQQDTRWHWFAEGEPLPQEDVASYTARRKRNRLDEARLMALLARLDARPWEQDYYALPGKAVLVTRPVPPAAIVRRKGEVVKG